MSGSLYTPYPVAGQPTSGGQAFREGFLGAQQIESNVQEMERRRQAARLAELQEQRSQAAEARAAERFPLDLKSTAAGINRTQQLLPLELDQSRLNLQRTQLQLREAEQALRDRGELTRMLREGFPTINFGGAPQTAPVPAAGVVVPPAAAAAAPAAAAPAAGATPPAAAPAATTGQQTSADGRPPWSTSEFDPNARFRGGVQLASAGTSETGMPTGMVSAVVEPGAPFVGADGTVYEFAQPTSNDPVIFGRPLSSYTLPELERLRGLTAAPVQRGAGLLGDRAGRTGAQRFDPETGAAVPTTQSVIDQRIAVLRSRTAERFPEEPLTAATTPAITAAPGAAAAATGAAATGAAATGEERPERGEELRFRTTTAAGQAVANNTPPSQPYIDRPMRVQADLNRLQTEYNDLQRLYRIAATSRDVATATRVVTRVREIQNEVNLLRGMQAITSFRDGNDAPLAAAIAEATRGPNQMQIQRAPDGTYNIFRDGRLVNTGVSREQIVANTRLYFDTEFRQEIQAARQRSIDEATLRANEGIKQTARMTAEIAIERVKQELARSAPNIEVRAVPNADGTQNLIYVDRSTSPPTTIGGARVVRVPPRPGSPRGTPDTFTIEAIPVTRN